MEITFYTWMVLCQISFLVLIVWKRKSEKAWQLKMYKELSSFYTIQLSYYYAIIGTY